MRYSIFLLLFLAGLSTKLTAQEPIYGLYWQNPFLYNPAYTGAEHQVVSALTYRRQWLGVEGAPQSINFGLHSPVGKSLAAGLNVQQQQASQFIQQAARLSLAYEFSITEDTYLRAALAGNMLQQQINTDNATAEQLQYLSDNQLDRSGAKLQWQAGVYLLHHDWLEVGFSLLNLTGQNLGKDEGGQPTDNFFASARVRRPLGSKLEISPGLVVQKFRAGELRTEASALLYWNRKGWLGGGYRLDAGPLMLFGLKLSDNFVLGYAYEFNAQLNQAFGQDTHEVQVKYTFKLPQKVKIPVRRPRFEL